ncbi:glycogen synthase GlgA [bacterium]|nr:glycogen synthase GlgA [bacterium]
MRILFLSSEAVPFVKTGGLADVAGALPRVLQQMGHDVRLVIPRYGDIDPRFRLLPLMPEIKVRWGEEYLTGSVLRCDYPGSRMPVYFIDEPSFSWRKGIYGTGKSDFADNDRRFAFFSMAALWLVKGLDWQPDVIHANDWQTGLVPALLKHHHEIARDPFFSNVKSVFAIHNMAYQGNVDKFVVPQIGLPWDVFTQDGMEFYGRASYLKAGIAYADAVVTVSPTYAQEIQHEEMGAGMHGTLSHRAPDLHGILNGIDTTEWNPETDPTLPARFAEPTLQGKANCKAELQKLCGLPVDPKIPVIGMASRLVAQKGFKLIADALDELLALDAQFVILGTGDEEFEKAFTEAGEAHPTRLHMRLAYDVPFSHRLIAGSDIFLMPSLFEPCGLTQLYSMRYGTVPVVRHTGGLADSVTAYPAEGATGFSFEEPTSEALVAALKSALDVYTKNPAAWDKLRREGMRRDWSWGAAAASYIDLYKGIAAKS